MVTSTQIRMNDESYKKLKIIAEEKQRSVNKQMNYVIEQFISDYEKVNGKIELTKE